MKWFNHLKVGVKVLISCSIFIILIIGISLQGINSSRNASSSFQIFFNEKFIPVRLLNQIMKNILQTRVNMLQEHIAAGTDNWEEFNNRIKNSNELNEQIDESWKVIRQNKLSQDEENYIAEFEKLHDEITETAVNHSNELQAKNFAEAQKIGDSWLSAYREARDIMEKLLELQQKEGEEINNQQTAEAGSVLVFSLMFLALAVVIGVVITVILSRSVSNPVRKGLFFAERMAEGDLTSRIDLDQKDELGQLGNALNKSADNLEKLIGNILNGMQALAQAVEQIAGGNQNLSQRTAEQASSLEEIASTIEETTATIKQNADNAQSANELAGKTAKMATEGARVVDNAVSSINEISVSSKKIGEIITMINEISFQTNLLSLNAAVEAARAGEQGRGFAVVAGEVRNLAQRSASAAKEIGTLISGSIEKIETGTELVNKSGEALKEIIAAVNEVNNVVAEIASASQEQKQGIDQVNTAVTEMDTMTQQNAALVEETASASEEISNQAQDLMALVEQFKVSRLETDKRNIFHLKPNGKYPGHTVSQTDSSHAASNMKDIHKIAADKNLTERRKNHISDIMHEEGFEEF